MATRPWRNNGSSGLAIALRLAACATAVAFLILAAGCGADRSAPEQQLREWVAAMETAAEGKARGDIMNLIAAAYNDPRGNARKDVDQLLRLYFLHQDRIALLTAIDDINITAGTAATMTVTVGMAGTREDVVGFDSSAYRFELELEADEAPESYADWRLTSARWGHLGDTLR